MSAAAESTPARLAYEAYRETVDGVSVNGDPLPGWDALSNKIQEGWRSAAGAGSRAYAEQTRAEHRGAAGQKVAREGAEGPSAKLAEAFMDSVDRLAGPGVPWSTTDSPANLQIIFADLMRSGHLQPGRATRTVPDRNKNYIPPGLRTDHRSGWTVEINEPRGLDPQWAQIRMAEASGLLGTLLLMLRGDTAVNPDTPAMARRWINSYQDVHNLAMPRAARTVRAELAGADELNGGEAGSWWWADVSGDGTHWAQFRGHMVQIDIELHTSNGREVNEWKGRDEIRAGGEWTLKLNRQQVASGWLGSDPLDTLDTIKRRARELIEHSALTHSDPRPYRQQVIGRKVYYDNHPAVVVGECLEQGCVILAAADGGVFPAPAWQADDQDEMEPDRERTVKIELWSPSVWWYRKRLVPGEIEVSDVGPQPSGEPVEIEVEDDDTADDEPATEEPGTGEEPGRWQPMGVTEDGQVFIATPHGDGD